jgi:hypothetical protein
MARFGQLAVRLRGGALFGVLWGMVVACGGSAVDTARDASEDGVEPVVPCGEDEVREYFCDDLLPLTSSRPAPEPYDNCPSTSDVRPGNYPALGKMAVFDRGITAYTRRRVQPGHSCCYGWCAKVQLADPSQAAPAACRDANGLHEGFCLRELESGTSRPAASPYERCPAAVKPPQVVAFAAPASALLDVAQTTQRRRETLIADCCYGWCTTPPSGTVLKTHPKIK